MTDTALVARGLGEREVDPAYVLASLPDPVLVVDEHGAVVHVNAAAEEFFDASVSYLVARSLQELVPFASPLLGLIEHVREIGSPVSEYAVAIGTPRTASRTVNLHAAPLPELPGWVLLVIRVRGMADKMDRQLTHRGAARAMTGMAQVLAHEIKNPLSGIRGAAQLLEQNASEGDRELARLIRDEVDRVCSLVDRMEAFSDQRPMARESVNIHEVLDHVRMLAENGFAREVRFLQQYDPSLPPVLGSRDQLIQVFLNLVKNAADAVPVPGGEIVLSTAYQPGVRLSIAGGRERLQLPLTISVRDNGAGIPEDLASHLFDPFVTTKINGTGLGLALVAKVVGDHGGLIEFESEPRRTVFHVRLPVYRAQGK